MAKSMEKGEKPCPCGNYGDPLKTCTCTPYKLQRYWSKLSGPLLDRIDIHLEVPRLKRDELSQRPTGDSSKEIRKRVKLAREVQQKRFENTATFCNARMTSQQIRQCCLLDHEAEELIKAAILHLGLSARAYDRILKVSRTIADLDNSEEINAKHIAEATQYRSLDLKGVK